jgi:predicted kinase
VIDATSLKQKHRRPFEVIAAAAEATFVHVRMTAPEGVILQRLEARSGRLDPFDHSTAGVEVYQHMKQELEPVRTPHRLVDSTDPAVYETALKDIAGVCLTSPHPEALEGRPAVELIGGSTGGRS